MMRGMGIGVIRVASVGLVGEVIMADIMIMISSAKSLENPGETEIDMIEMETHVDAVVDLDGGVERAIMGMVIRGQHPLALLTLNQLKKKPKRKKESECRSMSFLS